jgi:hypothetical protein
MPASGPRKMREFCRPFYIRLQSMSIVVFGQGAHDLLLIEEGNGLLIPKGIVKVKTEVTSAQQLREFAGT